MRFSSFTYLVGQGLHNLKANKMMTLASMGVLIVCMILVGAAFLFGANIDSMVAYIGEQNETVAFINDDADTAAVEEAIRSIPHVAGVEFISKDQMLDEYSQRLEGYTNLKEMFQNDNPLLANYVVRADDPANISSVAAALQNVDGVRAVNSPQAMSDLFVSLQKAVTYVCYGLVIVLAIVSVVVISNTIKITVFNRRKEIGIMKLVGATNGFIRFPFFVEGVTSGLISALIAVLLVGLRLGAHQDRIIIGTLMVLVPGIAFTNAMRDVMAGDMPYIFVKHIYACASLVGAVICGVLRQPAGEMTAMLVGAAAVFAIRCLSAHYRWNLPHPNA